MSGQVLPFGMQVEVQNEIDTYVAQRIFLVFESVMSKINIEEAEEILDIDGACKLLKCSEPKLNEHVKNGLKKHKSKKKVYYLRKECIQYIAELPGDEEDL